MRAFGEVGAERPARVECFHVAGEFIAGQELEAPIGHDAARKCRLLEEQPVGEPGRGQDIGARIARRGGRDRRCAARVCLAEGGITGCRDMREGDGADQRSGEAERGRSWKLARSAGGRQEAVENGRQQGDRGQCEPDDVALREQRGGGGREGQRGVEEMDGAPAARGSERSPRRSRRTGEARSRVCSAAIRRCTCRRSRSRAPSGSSPGGAARRGWRRERAARPARASRRGADRAPGALAGRQRARMPLAGG